MARVKNLHIIELIRNENELEKYLRKEEEQQQLANPRCLQTYYKENITMLSLSFSLTVT